MAAGVGGFGYAISWIGARVGDGTVAWPVAVVTAAAWVAVAASLAASTWAACFASSHRAAARAVAAAGVGVAVLVSGLVAAPPTSLMVAATFSWALGIPFERWTRFLARVPIALAVAGFSWWLVDDDPSRVVTAIAVGYPVAATSIAIGDRAWRTFAWRRAPA